MMEENKGKMLWKPSAQFANESNLNLYIQWLQANRGLSFTSYNDLWSWSTDKLEDFWASLWDYFEIIADGAKTPVLNGNQMPHYGWFPETSLCYSEHIFRSSASDRPAIIFSNEKGDYYEMSWRELQNKVSSLQQYFLNAGIQPGDRIAAYLPCTPQATISFLAANSIGAVWSSCSPDFGTQAVIDRFAQIEPKILIAVDRYTYNGKQFDKSEVVEKLMHAIPSVQSVILLDGQSEFKKDGNIISWTDALKAAPGKVIFKRVPFSHPIWILYSSGTTGLPKAICHSTGGILLEQLKYLAFHNNVKQGDRCFWYTTTGWMMWNYIQGSLLCGGTLVLYDGSPSYPDLSVLWKFIEKARITHFGTSAAYIMACVKNELTPGTTFSMENLASIGSTGSTLPEEGFEWIYTAVKKDLWLASISGGTDVCSAFVGGNPMWPVYSGEIQCRALGCSLHAYNDNGNPVIDVEGEMIIDKPMPSMPVYFWNDPDFIRYKESYFENYPGVWRHGDWIKITSRMGVVIYGRSDATLNRGGVRIGTSEIYRTLDQLPEIKDSLIVCVEKERGEFWMPLFVQLKDYHQLTDSLIEQINKILRTTCSPRHVPDEVVLVADIPYTISGKKTEMPVKKILMGRDPEKVVNQGSLRNPESMQAYISFARSRGIPIKNN